MIIKEADMTFTVKEKLRGGIGNVIIKNIIEQGEYDGKARLIATITIPVDSSIGTHIHDKEEEIFYVLQGEANYEDNGNMVVLKQGDSCICRSGQQHSLSNRSKEEPLVVLAIILTL